MAIDETGSASDQTVRRFAIDTALSILPEKPGINDLLVYAGLLEAYIMKGGFPAERETPAA